MKKVKNYVKYGWTIVGIAVIFSTSVIKADAAEFPDYGKDVKQEQFVESVHEPYHSQNNVKADIKDKMREPFAVNASPIWE